MLAAPSRAGGGQLEVVSHARFAGRSKEQGVHRPQEGREGPNRNEGVHGGGAVLEIGPGGGVERPARPPDDRCREDQGRPLPVAELQDGDHCHQDHRSGEYGRHDQAVAQRCQLGVVGHRGLIESWQRSGIAGLRDFGDQPLRVVAGGDRDGGLLRGVVDRRIDSVQPVQFLLDAHRARGARHSRDVELDVARGQRSHVTSTAA